MELLKIFLTGYICQILLTAGVIALCGCLIALLRRGFCALMGKAGPVILLITGIVGTPVHELSHAMMCILFGHKINRIRLYQPSSQDGNLGYVDHSYKKSNVYHLIGNFFIGTAPVTVGCGCLILIMLLLVPDICHLVIGNISGVGNVNEIGYLAGCIADSVKDIFDPIYFDSAKYWIFIVLAVMISSHMEMSASDVKSCLGGFGILAILWLVICGIIFLISPVTHSALTEYAASFGMLVFAFMSVALIFLCLLWALGLIIKLISLPFSARS